MKWMTEEKILVWHFIGADRRTVRGNLPVMVGETMAHEGEINLCQAGFHGSERLMHALTYANGPVLCRSELWGNIVRDDDKLVGRFRRCLWQRDITRELHEFALWCAEEALKLNPDPRSLAALEAKRHWLRGEIDDETFAVVRTAPWTAARAAALVAAWMTGKATAAREEQERRLLELIGIADAIR